MTKIKFILSIFAVAFVTAVKAQDATTGTRTDNSQLKSSVLTFVQEVESNRTVSVAAYPSYAPGIVVNGKKDTFGMGVAVLVPANVIPNLQGTVVGQHGYAGLRFDYLAHQAFASTIGVGMKEEFQLWSHNVTLFQQASANIPFSGFGVKNGVLGAALGGGLVTPIWQPTPNFGISLQVSAEKWTQFQGAVYHGGPVLSWSF